MPHPFDVIAHGLDAVRLNHWPLTGGVSASVHCVELDRDGIAERVVVREHRGMTAEQTATEAALLRALFDRGLPVPEVLDVDLSGTVLPGPTLVLSHIEGSTEPADLDRALEQMGRCLARIHGMPTDGLPELPNRLDPLPELRGWRSDLPPGVFTPEPGPPCLLHGDFWPGNLLWRGSELVGVIDWEDAAMGTPLSDLAGSRVEVFCAYGEAAMDAFTRHYRETWGNGWDPAALHMWELYVAAALLTHVGGWDLPKAQTEGLRHGAQQVYDRAAAALS